jgi:YD repeat-containing protein
MRHPFQLLFSLVLLCSASLAQVALGTPNFSAMDAHAYESVDLLNNNILLNVPGMSKASAMPFSFGMAANSSMINGLSLSGTWGPTMGNLIGTNAGAPFSASVNGALGSFGSGLYVIPTSTVTQTCFGNPSALFSYGWEIIDGNGTAHPLPFSDYVVDDTNCQQSFTDATIDGSGYEATIHALSLGGAPTIYTRDGSLFSFGTSPSVVDRNGNTITYSRSGNDWIDSLGLTTLSSTGGTAPSYNWTDVNGGSPAVSQTTTNLTLETNFGCSMITDLNNSSTTAMTTGFTLADNTALAYSYEGTPSHTGKYTGRIYQVTFPEGGYARYTYSGGSNGIDCTYQNPPILTRTLGNGDVTTYTLSHNLITGSNYNAVNKMIDPGGNETDYTFTGFTSTGTQAQPVTQAVTQIVKYQGNGSGKTLLETSYYCYNTVFSSCSQSSSVGATVSLPITKLILFRQLSGMTNWAATETHFDSYGNVTYSAQYDFGGSTPTRATTTTFGSCTASCTTSTPTITAIGSNINDRPGEVVTTQNGSTVAQANYTYSSHGNLLSTQVWNSSSFIGQTTNNTFNSNGTPASSYDLANNPTTYGYSSGGYTGCGSCTQYPFPTSITKGGLTVSATYNGGGGVITTEVDANSNTITYCYNTGAGCSGGTADPYWRVLQVVDPYSSVVTRSYPTGSSPDTSAGCFVFNSGNSTNCITATTDGYGRPINSQLAQSPSSTNYDTVSTAYSWAANYRTISMSQPCSVGANGTCSAVHTSSVDPLGRLYQEATTSNETITNTPSQQDIVTELDPAPSGENVKKIQSEYDGLSRVTKVCRIKFTGGAACGQVTGTSNGNSDSYFYTQGTGWTKISIVRGSQTRSRTFDALGRVTQIVTPEGGTWTLKYDSNSSCPVGYRGTNGVLASVSDPNGNLVCYAYDSLSRITGVNANGTSCRHFYFDNSTGYSGTLPSGVTLANPSGRMVEAATDTCAANTLVTDEWFAYDKDGRQTDIWESTPHSTQYYHSVATFFENGTVKTLQLASPSLYTMTYSLDGEGRWKTLTDTTSSTNIVTGATFYPAANPAVISFQGTTPDNDAYTFDTNTGRETQYAFTVGNTPATMTGALNWNANGSLKQLTITDGFNAGGTQTCTFNPTLATGTGYDDLGRIVGVDCGTGGWGQTFSYDMYDNLTKTQMASHIGSSWNPGYSATNNHYNCGAACTYDSNGNVTGDGNNVFGWNEYSKMKWTASSGTPTCGTSGMCVTYDAFGRIVETSNNLAWRTRWFTQLGETANMNGTTINFAYWPEPEGGTTVITGNSGAFYHLHSDWLGNARVASTISGHAITTDQAYSPYGEVYDTFGATNSYFDVFAGTTSNLANGIMWDTPNRELSVVGRWLSPDPAGSGWNQYAYPTNPNSSTDPSGLYGLIPGTINTPHIDPYVAGANQPTCNLDGLDEPCSQATATMDSIGGISGCDIFGCSSITYDPDTGLWTQIVGWRYHDTNGDGPNWWGPITDTFDPDELAQGPAANNGVQPPPGLPGVPKPPNPITAVQSDGQKEAACEQQAQAAFGPFVTPESGMTTLLSGAIGWILGKSVPAIGQGVAVSQVARFDVKAMNYNATLQACRQASGIGGLAQAVSVTP